MAMIGGSCPHLIKSPPSTPTITTAPGQSVRVRVGTGVPAQQGQISTSRSWFVAFSEQDRLRKRKCANGPR